jgi:hypothetical protein
VLAVAAVPIELRCTEHQQDSNYEALDHSGPPMERDRQPGRSGFKSFRHSRASRPICNGARLTPIRSKSLNGAREHP